MPLYGCLPVPKMTSLTGEEQRRPKEICTSAGTCKERCSIPHSQALGTLNHIPHILLYLSVIFRSHLKMGGQAGPVARSSVN